MANITNALELGKYATFDPSKGKPIYNWFYYKEAFSPELVEYALKQEAGGLNLDASSRKPVASSPFVFDPFLGIGTTPLFAKSRGLNSAAVDASPLAVFASKTKCDDYGAKDIEAARKFLEAIFSQKGGERENRLRWDFELFSPRAAFPKSNLNTILYIREQVETLEEKPRNLMLLALLSSLPLSSIIIKDGGVLRIDKRKRAMPAKEAFKRRAKAMLADLEKQPIVGPMPGLQLGDARSVPHIESGSVDISVTSPPYLNNIDYSKVYGLELSLLEMDKSSTARARSQMVRSFIAHRGDSEEMPPEVGDVGYKMPIVGTYFADMELVLKELYRVLKEGKACYFVVSNSIIYDTHIIVDEILAEMAERIGFGDVEIRVCLERFADVRPKRVKTRESIVVFRK